MIKESFSIYNRYLIQIMLLSVIIIIPLSIICYFGMVYLMQELDQSQYANLYALFLIIVNFTLVIPVFRRMAENDLQDEEESTLMDLIYEFAKHFGFIIMITIPVYIAGVLGSVLLFIPTIMALLIILLVPFFVDYKKIKDIFRQVGRVLLKENISLLFDFVIIISLHVLVWGLMMMSLSNFENSVIVFGFARSLVNALIFPILIFYLTQRYRSVALTTA
ncbi:hypothetical protein [Alkalibacillus silvisoli]|uniref:DUF975 family protein n=1 Tax=Alkalibacillus silvisoli TaxID=392823 RepID=A0ABP3JXT3_9BACI